MEEQVKCLECKGTGSKEHEFKHKVGRTGTNKALLSCTIKTVPCPECNPLESLAARLKIVNKWDDDEFEALINLDIKCFNISVYEISEQFDVSLPTVERWKKGVNAPHPYMRPMVYRFLRDKF